MAVVGDVLGLGGEGLGAGLAVGGRVREAGCAVGVAMVAAVVEKCVCRRSVVG